MANVWRWVMASVMLATLARADLNNSWRSQIVANTLTSDVNPLSAVSVPVASDTGENALTSKLNSTAPSEINFNRKRFDVKSKTSSLENVATFLLTKDPDEQLKDITLEKHPAVHFETNPLSSDERMRKLELPCILRHGYENRQSFREPEYSEIHQQREVIAPSNKVAAGAAYSTDTSNLQPVKPTASPVVLLGSTLDVNKTAFFVEDHVFKMKTKATFFRGFVSTEENTDPPMVNTFDSIEDDTSLQQRGINAHMSDVNQLTSLVDIEAERETNKSNAGGVVPTADHVNIHPSTFKSEISNIIELKNTIHVKASSEVVNYETHLEADSAHSEGPVKNPARINEPSTGGSASQDQNGRVDVKTNVKVSRHHVISDDSTRVAKVKSLEDIIIAKSIQLPVLVNLSGSAEDVLVVNAIELPTKTKVSNTLEDVVIIHSIQLPVQDEESLEDVTVANFTNLHVQDNLTQPLYDVTVVNFNKIHVKNDVSIELENVLEKNSSYFSAKTNESDSLEVIVINNSIAVPDTTKDPNPNSQDDIQQTTEEYPQTTTPSSDETFIEQRTRPLLDDSSSSVTATSTSHNVPGRTEKDISDITDSVVTYAQVDDNIVEIPDLDILAIDYDAVSDEPNTDTDYEDEDNSPIARSLFNAPRRRGGGGRYINGKFRASV